MDTKVITESGNNYVKFGNGLLIQWGYSGNSSTVTFPKPYTSQVTVMVAFNNSSPGSGNDWFGSGVKDVTNTSFFAAQGSGNTTTWGFWWRATGYA